MVLLAVIITCSAQTRTVNKPVVCDTTERVFKTIVEEFQETPQWQGHSPLQNTTIMLTVNTKTGAWTLIEFTSATACVIGVGENSSSRWGTPV